MRLFLLPISTRRTLIYCKRINEITSSSPTLIDKATARASRLWLDWEASDTGWKKRVTVSGNKLLQRIAFEEWGLKSIPPLSSRRRRTEELPGQGQGKVAVVYPPSLLATDKLDGVMRRLATERQALHRKRLLWSLLGMPITAPVALIPILPNIPFFYLAYRGWSHWRALSGSKHIEFLLDNTLLAPSPSPKLDSVYATAAPAPIVSASHSHPSSSPLPDSTEDAKAPLEKSSRSSANESTTTLDGEETEAEEVESMVLDHASCKAIAETLDVPELGVELDRAVTQVQDALRKAREQKHNREGR